MKKLLPRSVRNPEGFTLIELMIAITIVAILSMMGLVMYTTVQKNARDSRRRGDIDAIATALEANKSVSVSTYTALTGTQFSGGSVPTDPLNRKYCEQGNTTSTTPPTALTVSTWSTYTSCPTGWMDVNGSTDFGTAMSWTVCAALENSTTIYCRSSSQ